MEDCLPLLTGGFHSTVSMIAEQGSQLTSDPDPVRPPGRPRSRRRALMAPADSSSGESSEEEDLESGWKEQTTHG